MILGKITQNLPNPRTNLDNSQTCLTGILIKITNFRYMLFGK